MKTITKENIIAACKTVERNAEDIAKDMGLDHSLTVKMTFKPKCMPIITYKKKVMSKEVFDSLERSVN